MVRDETGIEKWGANMRLVSGFGCFLWGSLAVLLCAVPANPDRHVKAALAPLDAIAALAHSNAALATPELRTALADPDARADASWAKSASTNISGRCTNARGRSIPSKCRNGSGRQPRRTARAALSRKLLPSS